VPGAGEGKTGWKEAMENINELVSQRKI